MKVLLAPLLSACAISTALAQQPPANQRPEGIQKMLDAPVWFFNYRVTVNLSGSNGGRTVSMQRVINGSMKLGLRSQGPSLSMIANPSIAHLTTPEQFEFFVGNYANWISGLNTDETKTDQQNEAELIRVREQNIKAFGRFRWHYSSSNGQARGSASGSGDLMHIHEPALEFDAAKREYKLLFALLAFGDTVGSLKAVTGVDETGIGTTVHTRRPIETGVMSIDSAVDSIDPPFTKFITGHLPENFGAISYSSIHAIKANGIPGTLSLEFTLSPNPPEPVELWIELPPNYEKWQPIADKDEKTAGDLIPIKIVLQKPGGGPPRFKPTRFNFFLKNTTKEKGVCLNWPPNPEPNPPFDLQFEPDKNPDLLLMGNEGQAAVLTGPTELTAEVKISCFDYGAYGEFEASAELENTQVVYGIVRGTTDQQTLRLPKTKDGSKIATAFFDANHLGNLADDDDSENDPVGDGFKGDGLSLYEEYRGFMNGKDWMPGDPKKKDVFVLNELRGNWESWEGINVFERATGFNVHRLLRDNQVDATNTINFNRTSGAHVIEQHVIRMKAGVAGTNYANTADVGTPGTAGGFQIPPDVGTRRGPTFFISTVAHEMLHCCNVYHHGQKDKTVWWYYRPPENQMFETEMAWDAAGNAIQTGSPVPITVKKEDGTVIVPSTWFRPGITVGKFDLGLQAGEHSGAENCLMRYGIAFAYPSTSDSSVRYLTGGEPTGMGICTDRLGTGVNSGSHRPQSRYGAAALRGDGHEILNHRGNCKDQLRVNDRYEEPKR